MPEALDLDELLADVVRRVRQAIDTQARNSRWRLALPDGFADDCARNAAAALIDILERDDTE